MFDATAKFSGISRVFSPGPCNATDYHETKVKTESKISNGQGRLYSNIIMGEWERDRKINKLPRRKTAPKVSWNEQVEQQILHRDSSM